MMAGTAASWSSLVSINWMRWPAWKRRAFGYQRDSIDDVLAEWNCRGNADTATRVRRPRLPPSSTSRRLARSHPAVTSKTSRREQRPAGSRSTPYRSRSLRQPVVARCRRRRPAPWGVVRSSTSTSTVDRWGWASARFRPAPKTMYSRSPGGTLVDGPAAPSARSANSRRLPSGGHDSAVAPVVGAREEVADQEGSIQRCRCRGP